MIEGTSVEHPVMQETMAHPVNAETWVQLDSKVLPGSLDQRETSLPPDSLVLLVLMA